MTYKDLGPGASQTPQSTVPGGGQFSGDDHSFESVIFQQNKPVNDWEMNLVQDIFGSAGLRSVTSNVFPSCWLNNGFLERADLSDSFIAVPPDVGVGADANKIQMRSSDLIVNGWKIKFDFTYSATPNLNLFTVPAPPVAGKRTDLVILEVWRALVSAAPSMDNKSPSGQILRYGNAKCPDGPPIGNQNLADDLIDPTLAAETAARVQIQYRYRVITNVNLISYPDGLDDPAVVANTAPYYLASPVDGNATAYQYVKHPDDPGLWVAGVNSAVGVTALGTVDGLMYAVPIFAIFRRNSTAFSRGANPNGGGTIASGVSGRPDGLYADQIVLKDIMDMRRGVAWDLNEVLDKSFYDVMSGTLRTNPQSLTDVVGTNLSVHDDIGVGGHIGDPDGVRRNFSDRPIIETVVGTYTAVGPTSTVDFDLSALTTPWSGGAINVLGLAPTGINIVSIGRCHRVDAVSDTDMMDTASPVYVQLVSYVVNLGPGIDRVTLTLNANLAIGDTVYLEIHVEYPANSGISRNVIGADNFWTPDPALIAAWVDATPFSATSDANRYSLSSTYWWVNPGHRELSVRLLTTTLTQSYFNPEATAIYIPEEITGSISINDGVNPIYPTTNYTYRTGYTKVTLSFALPLQTAISVQYTALRPMPPVGVAPADSYQLFYTSAGIQSLPVPAGNQNFALIPRCVSKQLFVITNGTGSPDDGAPFSNPGEMIPVGALPVINYPESRLNAPNIIDVSGFKSTDGHAALPVYTRYNPNPGLATLYKSAPDTTIDGDGRNFWPKSDPGLSPMYAPTSYGQQFSNYQKRKTALPVIMEIVSNGQMGRKGTLVLVVFTDWSDFSKDNHIKMSPSVGSSCAAIFRLRGSLINPRRIVK